LVGPFTILERTSEEIEKREEKREGTRKNKNQLPHIFTYTLAAILRGY
jgi:hypothetical protein